MAGKGRPFVVGVDPRRNGRGRGASPAAKTMRALARDERDTTLKRLKELRDQKEDQRVALEASKLLVAYSDGAPGQSNVPSEEEQEGDAGDLVPLGPPTLEIAPPATKDEEH